MSIATQNGNQLREYLTRLTTANPSEALQIALAEAEREKAMAARAAEEYRAMAEVEFDSRGAIAKANLAGLYRLAGVYARTGIVPQHYQGKTEDCFIACQMAFRLGIDPLAYMQASYVVHGKPGIEAKLAIALLNKSGKIKGRLRWRYEGKGDSRSCTAFATDTETGDIVESTVSWAMVKAEKWDAKAGSKWISIPDIMFGYRSAAFLIRQYYPEVLMGISTNEELEDDSRPREEPARVSNLEGLMDRWGEQKTVEATAKPALEAPKEEATQEATEKPTDPPGSLDWSAVENDFGAAETLGQIGETLASWSQGTSEDEGKKLTLIADAHRQRIRSSRGSAAKVGA